MICVSTIDRLLASPGSPPDAGVLSMACSVSLLDFIETGEFPPFQRGMLPDQLLGAVGEPDTREYCAGPNGEPTIWTYEKLSVYLMPQDLRLNGFGMVFHEECVQVAAWTGRFFHLDSWIITADLRLSDLKDALDELQIQFDELVPEQPSTDRVIDLPSNVTLWFGPRGGEMKLKRVFSLGAAD